MMTLFIHEVLSGALLYSIFCRSISTSRETTRGDILFAFWLMGVAAIVMLAAPVVLGWQPDPLSTFLLFSIVTVQWVTAKHWHNGVPQHFRKPFHYDPSKPGQVDRRSNAMSCKADRRRSMV